MTYLSEALSVTLRTILWFMLVPFVLSPSRLHWPDRLMLGFSLSLAGSVVLAQALSAMGLWEPLSAWTVYLVAVAALLRQRSPLGGNWARRWFRQVDSAEHAGLTSVTRRWGRQAGAQFRQALGRAASHWLAWVSGAGLGGWALWMLYRHSLSHLYLPASDAYLHLAWVKYLDRTPLAGVATRIFQDGVYPYGYHAVVSTLSYLNFMDVHAVMRFIGPIGGVLLVLSAGYAAYRMGLGLPAVALSMGALAVVLPALQPGVASRLISPLPQEFAAIFVLPGVAGIWAYLRTGERIPWWIGALAVFLAASIHAYPVVYLAVGAISFSVAGLMFGVTPVRRVLRAGLASGGAALLGLLPMGIGLLAGISFQRSADYAVSQVQRIQAAAGLGRIWTTEPLLNMALIAAIVLVIAGAASLRRDRVRASEAFALGILLVLLFTQAWGRTGIPVVMDPTRSTLFLGLFLALGLGLLAELILVRVPVSERVATVAAIVSVVLLAAPAGLPKPVQPLGQYEYDQAAAAYLTIKDQHRKGDWTVVAPQEQLLQVLGSGYHEQIYEWAHRHSAAELARETAQLAGSDTGHVYVFIEKWPLGSPAPIEPDAAAALPEAALTGEQIIGQFYSDPAGRSLVEARAWGLMEAYRTAHPADVSIMVDDERLRVYHVIPR